MHGKILPFIVFTVTAALNIIQAFYYYPFFTDTSQVHFNISNAAESYSNKHTLFLFYGVLVASVFILILYMGITISKRPSTMVNIPDGDYWVTGERGRKTSDYLAAHLFWLGTLILLFFLDFFHQTIEKNIRNLDHLTHPLLSTGVFIVLLVLWYMRFNFRFRKKK